MKEYQIHGLYFKIWEEVTATDNIKDARQLLNDYRENENTSFKLVVKYIKKK